MPGGFTKWSRNKVISQVATGLNWQFLNVRAVQLDPVDLRGLPRNSADRAEWVPPKFLPIDGEGILYLRVIMSWFELTI